MSIDGDDLDDLAAEYVLGTLSSNERTAFEARLQRDPAAMRAVAQWAQRLQPLADAVTPAVPPATLWQRIERAAALQSRARIRRPMWIAAAVAAALVIAALLLPELMHRPTVESEAMLAPQGGQTAFAVFVLDDRSKLKIRPASVSAVSKQSYELWAVPSSGAPISLGVIDANSETERDIPPNLRHLVDRGNTLAVSLEPEGGSPTGAPTTVMFVGRLAGPKE